MILYRYHDTSWLPKIGRLRKCRLPKSMCNPKYNLVRMIRTMFGIGTIRKCVISVLKVGVEVELNLPTKACNSLVTFSGEIMHSNRSCYANLQLSRTIKTIVKLHSCCYAQLRHWLPLKGLYTGKHNTSCSIEKRLLITKIGVKMSLN